MSKIWDKLIKQTEHVFNTPGSQKIKNDKKNSPIRLLIVLLKPPRIEFNFMLYLFWIMKH